MINNGRQIVNGDNRVLRGGSWINNGRNCRSARRNMNQPDRRNNNIGFRLSLAQNVIGKHVNDQIVFQTCAFRCISKKQGHRHVSSVEILSGESLPVDCFNTVMGVAPYKSNS